MDFDIVYLADIRFPGGTSTALLYELRAAARAGLKAGLIPVASPILARSRPPNPKLLDEIRDTRTVIVPAQEIPRSRVAFAYHPTLLDPTLAKPPRFKADTFALVAHHPPLDRFGRPAYDAENLSRVAKDMFGHELSVLPVGPTVRKGFDSLGLSDLLHTSDWNNLIDVADFAGRREREISGPLAIGRHSRPGREKWPDPAVALQAYPDDERYQFRMLGVDPAYLKEFGDIPANWHVLPFSSQPVAGFLKGLDAYSYFHSPAWIEAFGYGVLEALATGLPAVLPHYFSGWFEEAALYSTPAEAPEHYDRLLKDKAFRTETSEKARRFASERYGLDLFAERFGELAGNVRNLHPAGPSVRRRAPEPPVVMAVTSNGIGLGHLTRQLAISRALGPGVKVVFFSLSEAVIVAQNMGYLVEFRPFHRRLACDVKDWNDFFYREMRDALAFYRPHLVSFDGNTPYAGLLDAVKDHGDAKAAWIRRGMWRSPDEAVSARGGSFDLVVEPGELAGVTDPGHARAGSDHFVKTDPVVLVDRLEAFSRATARRLLHLPQDVPLGLIQLGSERNFNMAFARRAVDAALSRNPDVHFVEIRSPISAPLPEEPHERLHRRTAYPLGLHLNAFDFAVTAAGYNSFHELLAASLPTVFVPNAAPEMDLQENRSFYAQKAGWSLHADAADPFRLEWCLEEILRADVREELRETCRRIPDLWNGAGQVASLFASIARLPAGFSESPVRRAV